MKFIKILLSIIVILFFQEITYSQSLAFPFINNYSSKDYNADGQNWSLTQDTTGYIYVGNSLGVLQFNGVNWNLIKNSNNSLIRSLKVHKKKNLTFVGGVGDFGFLSTDKFGKISHHSLLELMPDTIKEISDVWKTHCIGDKVFFQTFDFIVEFQIPKNINVENFILKNIYSPKKKFHFSFTVDDVLYVRVGTTVYLS